jgi:meso-butanediol dehydrogenase/(S,S)-butanediol dehydrogenase/diacetyl reductase
MGTRLQGRIAVITGAGSGIGEATARRFVEEGATVILSDTVRDKIDETVADLPEGSATAVVADSSQYDQVARLIDTAVEQHGRLDILVNNAGTQVSGPVEDLSLDDWRKVISTDLDGVFYGTKAAMPHLLKTRGVIVNTSSVSGIGGDWNMSAYNAAKGGVSNFTRAVALDHGADGVRVNAVAPSLTRTEMTAEMQGDEDLLAAFAERIPMRRQAEADEIAKAIVFLASDDASFITGVVLPVDGGLSASNGQPRQA